MWRAALKNIWSHKMRSGLLSMAILAGVAMIVAAFVFTDTIGAAFEGLFSDAFAATDIQVRREIDPDLDFGLPERMSEELVGLVETVDGVEGAWGSVAGLAQLVAPDGELYSTGGAPILTGSWTTGPSSFTIKEGRAPTGPGEVLLDAGTAERAGYAVGDTVEVLLGGPKQPFTLVGLVGFGEADNLLGAGFVLFEHGTAQQLLDAEEQVDAIEATVVPGTDIDSVLADLNGVLPPGIEAVSSQTAAEEQVSQIKEGLGFLNTFLVVFGIVALFVGTFVIYNAFRIVVAQRTRELGLLRAVGASRRQVTLSVVLESAVTGVIASLIGVGAGVGLALLLEDLLEVAFGGDLPDAATQLPLRTIILGMVAGTVATVVSALIPAARASRIPPIAAIRDIEPPSTAHTRKAQLRTGLPVLAVGALGMVLGLTDNSGPFPAIALVGVGAGIVFIGVYILSPLIARPAARLLGLPMRSLSESTGKLAQNNAMRSPRRTAATAGALMIGLALVTTIAMLAASIRDTATGAIEETFTADLLLQTGGFSFTGFSPEAAERVEALDEVELATGVQGGPARVLGSTTFVAGIDPAVIGEFFRFESIVGDLADLSDPDAVATITSIANDEGLAIGDSVDIGFARTGEKAFTLVAIIDFAGGATDTQWFLSRDTFGANYTDAQDMQAYIRLADGVDLEQGRAAVTGALGEFPGIEVQDQEELREQIASQINQFVFLVFGLLGMSIIIALIGITLTLLLSVYERTREIGLLRALGMARQQVRNMIGLEAVIIALFGAFLGVAVGLVFGWAIASALALDGLVLSVPWLWIAGGFVGAAIAGIVAAAGPAFRASNLDVLQAIAYE